MSFPAIINLSNAATIIAGDTASAQMGLSISGIGDVNGDGYEDFAIGAPQSSAGAVHVVFGQSGGLPANFSVTALDGSNGFKITGQIFGGLLGWSVAAAGDVNGDGVGDMIIGARNSGVGANFGGSAYVLFGSTGLFAPTQSVNSLNGDNGFALHSNASFARLGRSVTSVGDINGDGFDDVAVGMPYANGYAGKTIVVFGKEDGFAAAISAGAIDGVNGFVISGLASNTTSGFAVGGGDVNGDGIGDLVIGAPHGPPSGNSYGEGFVIYGSTAGFGASFNLASLDGTNGFRVSLGEQALLGRSIAVGDFNGDGVDDVAFGAEGGFQRPGAAYVVFGAEGSRSAVLDAGSLNGTNGFRITGLTAEDQLTFSISAGDLNGDGYDDLILGAKGRDAGATDAGSTYVVFGKASGFASTFNLASLDGTNGFEVRGTTASDASGAGVSTADVNGDGILDLLVSADRPPTAGADAGAAYVIYGTSDTVTFSGGAANETVRGAGVADSIWGGDGNDVLSGLAGDDLLDGGALSDVLNGGAGADDLIGGAGGDILSGDDGADQINGGEGADKLFGGAGADQMIGGLGNDRFDGGAQVDTLTGEEGNDYLDGGAGDDLLIGGAGNDVYLVDSVGDQTIEQAPDGYDIVRTALDGVILAANIEALELQGSADIAGTGNGGANNLQGNSGSNRLDGAGGVDTLNGGDGDDIILGGAGSDLLRGGLGADTFVVAHVMAGALETDQVYDFSTPEGDVIDLSGAFDGTIAKVDAFSKVAGQMTLSFNGGMTTLKLDVNGDGRADYQMKVNGDVTGDSGGWLL